LSSDRGEIIFETANVDEDESEIESTIKQYRSEKYHEDYEEEEQKRYYSQLTLPTGTYQNFQSNNPKNLK
jgi:hypothetical protein